ncbi:MAG: ankyrin repeat domain-containing protein [Verrucomicrobiia bacterium]|jgi:serine/threonine-protein phosphatase 6 regulatory ankyrin repeat subunit B
MRLLRLPIILLVALVCCGFAFCGEIHEAVGKGDLEKVKALLKANPDLVFSKDDDGGTPLHYVALPDKRFLANYVYGDKTALAKAYKSRREIAELLLNHKADINVKNKRDETPLFIAARKGDQDIVELLLNNHADVNTKTKEGRTPLFEAACKGLKDIVKLLLDNKADVNASEVNGWTPLHSAVSMSANKDVVELLLIHKADSNAKLRSGETPLGLAIRTGHKDIAELLRQHGGYE